MPDTIFTQNINEVKKFIKKNKRIIIKPIHSFGGNDIFLLSHFNSQLIDRLIKKHNHIMCQRFLSKIKKEIKEFLLLMVKYLVQFQEYPKKDLF